MPTWKTGLPNVAIGAAPIVATNLETTAKSKVGTVQKFYDETQGEIEAIYLPGVASTVAGDVVSYDLTPGAPATTRLVKDVINNKGYPVAVALAPVVAGNYGWYQISGVAIVNATAASAAGGMFATATAGQVNSAADAGDQILGARLLTALGTPTASTQYAYLNRPHIQGQIT